MKFLKALATPFIKLWNWIKQTAWVQPLLIVGCIFAVIFSIPYIADGIKNVSKKEEDTMKYYKDNSFSIKGAYKGTSKADEFLGDYITLQKAWDTKDTDESKTVIEDMSKQYGEKFFFAFVGSECEQCDSFSQGFKYLEKNSKDFALKGTFKLHSIIVDEKIDGSEKNEYKEDSPYKQLFDRNSKAFEEIVQAGLQSFYAQHLVSNTDYKNKLQSIMISDSVIEVPLVCLIDLTAENTTEFITTQVFYSISGDNDIDKAQYLTDAWNYQGETFGKELN